MQDHDQGIPNPRVQTLFDKVLMITNESEANNSAVAEHFDAHSHDEAIPFLSITSPVNVRFPILLDELGLEND
jgi:hypothetical protein